tara:strand:- start:907 stop:1878 length:972 start_codon:yes stop_codon:yes gene_type:complete
MPYIGNDPGAITDAFTQSFTGDASDTAFTLSQASTTNSVFVRISGVMQRNGTDFNVDGVTLTFTTAPPAGTNNIVVQYFTVGSVQTIADDAVATAKIADSAVSTAKIADNAITLAKLAGGTDGNIISFDASGDPVAIATGSDGQVLTSTGAGSPPAFEALSAGFTQGTEIATTSGTSITFGSIPAGVDMIVMNFFGVSQGSNSQTIRIQIGDGGGIETSGYLNTAAKIADQAIESATIRNTAGFSVGTVNWDAANILHGSVWFTLQDAAAFTWCFHGMLNESDDDGIYLGSGSKALSAELTQIKFSTAAGATFDAGAVNIMFI